MIHNILQEYITKGFVVDWNCTSTGLFKYIVHMYSLRIMLESEIHTIIIEKFIQKINVSIGYSETILGGASVVPHHRGDGSEGCPMQMEENHHLLLLIFNQVSCEGFRSGWVGWARIVMLSMFNMSCQLLSSFYFQIFES